MKLARTWIVFIGADPEIARELSAILDQAGYTCTAFRNTDSFLAAVNQTHPRCLIVDINPAKVHLGLASIEALIGAPWRWPTIVLNARGELPAAIKAMRVQNIEFLQEPYAHRAFLKAVRRTKRLKPYRTTNNNKTPVRLARALSTLTPREIEIASEMIYGRSTKEIATKLTISTKTVELHRTRVLQKMRVRSTGELVGLYLDNS